MISKNLIRAFLSQHKIRRIVRVILDTTFELIVKLRARFVCVSFYFVSNL